MCFFFKDFLAFSYLFKNVYTILSFDEDSSVRTDELFEDLRNPYQDRGLKMSFVGYCSTDIFYILETSNVENIEIPSRAEWKLFIGSAEN